MDMARMLCSGSSRNGWLSASSATAAQQRGAVGVAALGHRGEAVQQQVGNRSPAIADLCRADRPRDLIGRCAELTGKICRLRLQECVPSQPLVTRGDHPGRLQ